MSVITLDTADFRGLRGTRKFEFEKLNAVTAPTGSGKSSILDALKFAMTGIEPDGEIVSSGADRCAVQVTFPSGGSFARIRYRGSKPSKYKVNGKTSSLAKMNAGLQNEFGNVSIGNAKLIASGEMLSAIDSKQFGDLILSYMPESMTKEDVLQMLRFRNDYIDSTIRTELPDGDFGVEAIDAFYNLCTDRKKLLRSSIRKFDAALTAYSRIPYAEGDVETLSANIRALQQKRDEQVLLSQKKGEYVRAQEALARFNETTAGIRKEIGSISALPHTEDERRSAQLVLEAHRATVTASYSAVRSAEESEKALENAIRNVTQPVCPLSDKLVCTTDKTKVINEMTESLLAVKKQIEFQKDQMNTAKQKAEEAEQALRMIDRDNAEVKRREGLVNQLDQLLKNEPKVPAPPAEPEDIGKIDSEIERLRRVIYSTNIKKEESVLKEKKERYAGRLANYEYMAQAFSPKGEVKQAITEMYLKEFETPCNEKAAKIFENMKVRLAAENGVTIYCDPDGGGNFISFDSLSAGEKAAVTFLLVLTIASISGFRIVIMDELSLLDKETFRKLLEVIKDAGDEYDMAVVACVDHDDTDSILKEYGINMLQV